MGGERARERERERKSERERDRESESERERDRERQRDQEEGNRACDIQMFGRGEPAGATTGWCLLRGIVRRKRTDGA